LQKEKDKRFSKKLPAADAESALLLHSKLFFDLPVQLDILCALTKQALKG
jgi:hypothetical protein